MSKIKVNIITGFLGAGKTTAILNLLKQKDNNEDWAIIINEFGKISIDYLTLSKNDKTGRLYEISGGCICCSAKSYFHDNLNKIIKTKKYDRIIIEPSGLGGPDMVAEIIFSHPELNLMPIICLIDYKGLENKRLQLIPMYRNQIEKADILVLSKCDLIVNSNEIDKHIKTISDIFPGKMSYITCSNKSIYSGILDGKPVTNSNKNWIFHAPGKNIISKTFTFSGNILFEIEQIMQLFMAKHEIIRVKGFLNSTLGWRNFNYTLTGSETKVCSELPKSVFTVFAETTMKNYFDTLEDEISKTKSTTV